jgi:amidase
VLDTAVWLDAVAGPAAGDADTPPTPERSFVEAARSEPGRLRVALSFKPSSLTRVDPAVRAAVERVADELRTLGHEVTEQDPDYGELSPLFLPRWARGIADDVALLPHPERLERRTRRLARLGALVSDSVLRRSRAGEQPRAQRINTVFEDHDVLLTPTIPAPPDPLGRFEGRSLAVTLMLAAGMVAFTQPWNVTGQPAASIPAPTEDGIPIGAQLVGRPGDEATLLSLSAQLERELGWPKLRPPGV